MFNETEIHEYIKQGLSRLVELSDSPDQTIATEASANLVGLLLEYRKQQKLIDVLDEDIIDLDDLDDEETDGV